MKNRTHSLNETLASLESKVKLYLDLERDISLLEVELLSLQSVMADFNPEQGDLQQEGLPLKDLNDKEQKLAAMLEQYEDIKIEVAAMLPEKNTFVKVNSNHGSSMVGYFTTDPDTNEPLPEPVLRVVH